MFAEAKIIIATKKGFSVPNEAIIKESDKNFVYLLQNQQSNFVFKKTLVKVGEASEDFTEILPDDHVHQNSKILAKGVFDISN